MKYTLFTILSAVLILTSCGGKTGGSGSNKETKQDQFIKANAIIGYTNKVIDESNHINSWVESNERQVIKLTEIANNPVIAKNIHNLTFFHSAFGFSSLKPYNSNSKSDLRVVSDLMDDADKTYFSENAEKYYSARDGLLRIHKEIQTYVEQEDYKDDKGAQGKVYADSVKYYYLEMVNTIGEMVGVAADLGAEAELLTLEDFPLRDVILLMREQMKLSRELIENYRVYGDKAVSKEEVTKLYTQYVEVTDNNIKKGEKLKLTDTKRRYFDSFMESNSKLSGYLKIANRSVQADEKFAPSTLSSCDIYYDALIRHYNDVVK